MDHPYIFGDFRNRYCLKKENNNLNFCLTFYVDVLFVKYTFELAFISTMKFR